MTKGPQDRYQAENFPDTLPQPVLQKVKCRTWPWLLLILLIFLGLGYFYYWVFEPTEVALKEARLNLISARKAEQAQRAELATLAAQLEIAYGHNENLAALVAAREQEINELIGAEEELTEKLHSQIAEGDIAIRQSQGQLVVDLVDKLLFPSGEAELGESGKAVLKQVGETFVKIPDKIIQVSGHTDNVPISAKLSERFATNWELSTARAVNVVRFLENEVKVPGARLFATGHSEFKPREPNTTKQGRKKNRRIEVILLPLAK